MRLRRRRGGPTIRDGAPGIPAPAPPPASATPQPSDPQAAPGAAATETYTVVAGDTLFTIAAAQGVPGGWPTLYQANRDTISDPAAINPDQVLRLG